MITKFKGILFIAIFQDCKIIRDPGSDPYCFIEFAHHQAASAALTAMNRRLVRML